MNTQDHNFFQQPKSSQVRKQAHVAATLLGLVVDQIAVDFPDEDSADRVVTVGSEQFHLSRQPKDLKNGTIFQTPGAISLQQKTVEHELHMALETRLRDNMGLTKSNAHNLAGVFVRVFCEGVWEVGAEDSMEPLAKAARKMPESLRPKIAVTASVARGMNPTDGIKWTTQALGSAPILFAIMDPDRLGYAIGHGWSIKSMLRDLGVTPIAKKLSSGTLTMINEENIGDVIRALDAVTDEDMIPKGTGQKRWLAHVLPVMKHEEPAPNFHDWLANWVAIHTKKADVQAASPIYHTLSAWAEETFGMRGGWNNRKNLVKSFSASEEYYKKKREEMRAAASGFAEFPRIFQDFSHEKLFVHQISTVSEMIATGDRLNNCMNYMCSSFARRAASGLYVYGTIHNAKKEGDLLVRGEARSAFEINLSSGNPVIAQHYARENRQPTVADAVALNALVKKLGGGVQ